MNYPGKSWLCFCWSLCAFGTFDMKVYERSLKNEIPWSLTGSAQDLRSDAKHQLQLILRSLILLRPDVPWEGEKPSIETIEHAFKELKNYVELKKDHKAWVKDSLDYMQNTYIPSVKKMLEDEERGRSGSRELLPLIDQKKVLLQQFSQKIAQEEADLFKASPENTAS